MARTLLFRTPCSAKSVEFDILLLTVRPVTILPSEVRGVGPGVLGLDPRLLEVRVPRPLAAGVPLPAPVDLEIRAPRLLVGTSALGPLPLRPTPHRTIRP